MESLTKIDNCAPYKTHENGKMWQCFYKQGNFGRETAAFGGQAAILLDQTGEPWHLLCHGGKTPAKPHVREQPARYARRSGCRAKPCQTGEP